MPTLTITAKGQITLKQELLEHLGVRPGDKLHVGKTEDGGINLRPAEPAGALSDLFGSLRRYADRPLSLDELSEIAAQGWARRR